MYTASLKFLGLQSVC